MEHSLHLVAKLFVETIVPGFSKQHSTSAINTKGNHVEDDKDNSNDENDNFDAANSLGKAIALVKQVRLLKVQSSFAYGHANTPFRFTCLHRQELFSMQCAAKSVSHRLSSFYGSVLDGFPFQVSRLPHPTQTGAFDIYIIARTDISLRHRQSTNSFSLQMRVRMCQI